MRGWHQRAMRASPWPTVLQCSLQWTWYPRRAAHVMSSCISTCSFVVLPTSALSRAEANSVIQTLVVCPRTCPQYTL